MTLMLEPQPGESVYDPTCGTGGMLISTAAEVKRQGKEWRNLRLYGQELNYGTSAIARMNLFLHGITDGHIAHGDTLARPAFLNRAGGLQTFDIVLANPPYSIKAWNRDAFAKDPYGRNLWGVPPQGRADYAFFQHIAKSLDPRTGRAAILFPHGVLFRREEAALREALVKSDLLECVLGLGAGLFYNSPMEAVVITLRATKPADHRGKVLFINAVNDVAREQAQSFLRETHQQKILDAYQPLRATSTSSPPSRPSTRSPTRATASPSRSTSPAPRQSDAGDQLDVIDAVAEWRTAADTADQALADVLDPPASGGDPVSLNLDKSTWTRVDLRRRRRERPRRRATRPTAASIATSPVEHMDTDDLTIHRWGDVGRRSTSDRVPPPVPAGTGPLRLAPRPTCGRSPSRTSTASARTRPSSCEPRTRPYSSGASCRLRDASRAIPRLRHRRARRDRVNPVRQLVATSKATSSTCRPSTSRSASPTSSGPSNGSAGIWPQPYWQARSLDRPARRVQLLACSHGPSIGLDDARRVVIGRQRSPQHATGRAQVDVPARRPNIGRRRVCGWTM